MPFPAFAPGRLAPVVEIVTNDDLWCADEAPQPGYDVNDLSHSLPVPSASPVVTLIPTEGCIAPLPPAYNLTNFAVTTEVTVHTSGVGRVLQAKELYACPCLLNAASILSIPSVISHGYRDLLVGHDCSTCRVCDPLLPPISRTMPPTAVEYPEAYRELLPVTACVNMLRPVSYNDLRILGCVENRSPFVMEHSRVCLRSEHMANETSRTLLLQQVLGSTSLDDWFIKHRL